MLDLHEKVANVKQKRFPVIKVVPEKTFSYIKRIVKHLKSKIRVILKGIETVAYAEIYEI